MDSVFPKILKKEEKQNEQGRKEKPETNQDTITPFPKSTPFPKRTKKEKK